MKKVEAIPTTKMVSYKIDKTLEEYKLVRSKSLKILEECDDEIILLLKMKQWIQNGTPDC
jgi:hypothetical protein